MRRIFAFLLLAGVKTFSHIFYRGHFKWITPAPDDPWANARLMVIMNHTSLYEPLFVQALSLKYLWHLAAHMNIPGADVTLNRPLVGTFWKLLVPNIQSVSRKKDATWENYLDSIRKDDVVIIAPEGRMKRPNGLDKDGKPMTVRGGVADIIENLDKGGMVLCLSGGLHHVQAPGQFLPRLFKNIHMNLAWLDIDQYKAAFPSNSRERKIAMIQDLQRRLENDCPPQV